MSFAFAIDPTQPPDQFYDQLALAAESLLTGETDQIANAANLSALIYATVPNLNWAGFYFLKENQLVVGPFQGLPACVRIPLGKGVCGTAAQSRSIQRVADVNQFPGHIACDGASRSELVIPLVKDEALVGVLDLDSPEYDRFSEADQAGIARLAEIFLKT